MAMDKKVFDKKVLGFTSSIAKANAALVVLLLASFVTGDQPETERRLSKLLRVIDGDAQQGRVLAWLNAYLNAGVGVNEPKRLVSRHVAADGQEYVKLSAGVIDAEFEHADDAATFAANTNNPMSWRGVAANKPPVAFDNKAYAATVAKRLLENVGTDGLNAFIVALQAEVNKAKVANVESKAA